MTRCASASSWRAAPPGLGSHAPRPRQSFQHRVAAALHHQLRALAQQRRQRAASTRSSPFCAVSRLTTPNSGADGYASSSPISWRSAALLRSLPARSAAE